MTQAPFWKRAAVNLLDLLTVLTGAGLLVRAAVGNTAGAPEVVVSGVRFSMNVSGLGFAHSGMPALVVVGLVIAYFVIGRRFAGGTI